MGVGLDLGAGDGVEGKGIWTMARRGATSLSLCLPHAPPVLPAPCPAWSTFQQDDLGDYS